MNNQKGEGEIIIFAWIFVVAFLLLGGVGGCMYVVPKYRVYSQEMTGKAMLARAINERRVQIEQARGEAQAAAMRAQAIAIVGKASKDFPEYRQQEFIGAFAEALKEGKIQQIMYVPTEANIPITEASRAVPK